MITMRKKDENALERGGQNTISASAVKHGQGKTNPRENKKGKVIHRAFDI